MAVRVFMNVVNHPDESVRPEPGLTKASATSSCFNASRTALLSFSVIGRGRSLPKRDSFARTNRL
jgi:hypothetical protein